MLTFKEYLLEYQLKRNAYSNIVKMKAGSNGKDRNRVLNRKHSNTDPKKYQYGDNVVDKIMNGSAQNVRLSQAKLDLVLTKYGIEFKPNTVKGLGNSGVEVEMFEDRTGLLTKKK